MNQNISKSYEKPIATSNQLADIIRWLKSDDIVVIHNIFGEYRIFYKSVQIADDLSNRIIVIKCETFPNLLDDGEWNHYITEAGNIESKSHEMLTKINQMIIEKSPNIFLFIS